MSLRARLIIAFFVLSVLPLGAVTVYSYLGNVEALRVAAEREADLLAGELGQRMHLVTTQLSERVEHLMDLSELQAEVQQFAEAQASPAPAVGAAAPGTPATSSVDSLIAGALGEAAMLLNNVDLRGLRGGGLGRPPSAVNPGDRSGGPPRTSDQPGRPPDAAPAGGRSATGAAGTAQAPRVPTGRLRPPPPSPLHGGAVVVGPPTGATTATEAGAAGTREGGDPRRGGSEPVDPNRLLVDLGPMRRVLMKEMFPEGSTENLSPEERARLGREINARMLGVVEGIRIGAVELQKRADAAKAAAVTAAPQQPATPAKPPAPVVPLAPSRPAARRTELSGRRLGITRERDGQVVQQVSAEINLPNVLATVFSTTRRDRGEIPFAVGLDGTIHAPNEEDRLAVEALGDVVRTGPPAATRVGNWIVVTTNDTSGALGRMGILRPVNDSLQVLRRTAVRNAALGLGFIGLALIGIIPLSGRLTRNLSSLGEGVNRLSRGDYAARVPVRSQDEIGRLAAAFNQMAADVERHQRSAVEQERIRRELELGRIIQNEMLPHAPLRVGLTEIKGVSVPAREVGGDFFNYFELPDGRLAMLLGDVSGKGVGAALLMANLQASLRTRLALGQDLAAIANAIDLDVDSSSPGPVYATLFVGILDPVSRMLRYVNAGHNPQFVLRHQGDLALMSSAGLPVGMLSGRGYVEQDVQLEAGDVLFFYTDGCVEAEDEAGEMFGSERLEGVLHASIQAGISDDVLERVERVVKAFRGSREPYDDATMMTLRVG